MSKWYIGNELQGASVCHFGILGQKWGVRRYQNSDGSLTAEGKERYRASDYASKLYQKALKNEPRITKDIYSIVANTSAKMYGLEHRLKTKESINRKIVTDSINDNISIKKSAQKVKDTIRYTALSPDKDFTKNYFKIKMDLQKKGYKEIRCKNYFDLYNKGKVKHKSVQSVFLDPFNNIFELQFHTEASQDAKNKKIPLYEEARKVGISPKRLRELEYEMEKLAESIPDPKDVYKIQTHD